MKSLSVALCALAIPVAAQTFDSVVVKDQCARDWKDNFTMQESCFDQSTRGFDSYMASKQLAEATEGFSIESFTQCERDWAPRWFMVNSCAGQNIIGRQYFLATLAELPRDVASTIQTGCARYWPTSYMMQANCGNLQAQEWRDLQ